MKAFRSNDSCSISNSSGNFVATEGDYIVIHSNGHIQTIKKKDFDISHYDFFVDKKGKKKHKKSQFDFYSNRGKQLEHVSLYDWVATINVEERK